MRMLIAVALPVAGLILGHAPAVSADDAAVIGPLPSLMRTPTAAVTSFGLVLPEESEPTLAPAAGAAANEAPAEGAPATGAPTAEFSRPATYDPGPSAPPDYSYEEISDGYPAPAHTLVPPALATGPVVRGAGSWGGATGGGIHLRYPYYSYRSPWTYGGPVSVNHTIHW